MSEQLSPKHRAALAEGKPPQDCSATACRQWWPAASQSIAMKLKRETTGFVRGGMLFLKPPWRWRVWQRDVWTCCELQRLENSSKG